jgi:ribonucleoside-diphosphate reductase alpha chain
MPTPDLTLYPQTVESFGGNEQRATVFLDRYSAKNMLGEPTEDHPMHMWTRVANAIGKDGAQIKKFYDLLEDFKFVPGGRILAGAGTESEVTYYNCYVIPIETKARRQARGTTEEGYARDSGSDSREAIFDTMGLMVEIMSRGGGVGINWSVLRPKGTHLKRINGTTSGPVSWMDVASRAVGVVEQGGSRRGAAMFMLDDWHPDLMEFIDAKRDYKLITNANVSVAVSDDFMAAVKAGDDWVFQFPDTSDDKYNSEWDGDLAGWKARGGRVKSHGSHPAREIWRRLSEAAWASGEPGVVFLDRYNALSTGQGVERIISVNPCGEQGLGPYSVCNLGAMNLAAYVKKNRNGYDMEFDWLAFSRDCADATEFLDRVIDVNYYFIPENEAIQKKLRRIGLGVLGLADALIALKMRYGSPEAVKFTEQVFYTMKHAALSRSSFLAKDYGAAPGWDPDMINRPYLAPFKEGVVGEAIRKHGLRNLFLLTQAPTGTTSLLAGVNSGIEPYFAFSMTRVDRTGTHKVIAPVIEKYHNPQVIQEEFVTSNDISVEEHVAMQAAAQKHIDSSVSKTINGPEGHTVEDVEKAYTLAYESGCKGVAYFRNNSGRDQVLYTDDPVKGDHKNEVALEAELERKEQVILELQEQLQETLPHAVEFERPKVLHGTTVKAKTKAGTAYVTVNEDGTRPVEMFVNVGKAGSDIMELGEAIGRLASLALASGAGLKDVSKQLVGIGGNGKFNKPLAHAIGQALEEIEKTHTDPVFAPFESDDPVTEPDEKELKWIGDVLDGTIKIPRARTQTMVSSSSSGKACPQCSNFSVVREEGCEKCHLCGWSAC